MTFILVLNVQSQSKFWSDPSLNLEVLGKFILIEVELRKCQSIYGLGSFHSKNARRTKIRKVKELWKPRKTKTQIPWVINYNFQTLME